MGNDRFDLLVLIVFERIWFFFGVYICWVFCFEVVDEVGDIVGSIMSCI